MTKYSVLEDNSKILYRGTSKDAALKIFSAVTASKVFVVLYAVP